MRFTPIPVWKFPVVLLFTIGLFAACEPEDNETEVEILVVDSDSRPVPDAFVLLYCDGGNCVIRDSAFTNSKGVTNHVFDNPAVLFIEATATLTEDSIAGGVAFPVERDFIGQGIVTLEEDEKVEETVQLERQ